MADIERMRAALVAARNCVAGDRAVFAASNADPKGQFDDCAMIVLNDYDALLAQIDAALAQEAQK